MTDTIESLATELKTVKAELANMTKRTGCPSGFLPVYKLAIKHSVTGRVIQHIISLNPRMAKRTYSTKHGGHIVNCKAYKTSSFSTAFDKFMSKTEPVGRLYLRHDVFMFADPYPKHYGAK